MQKLLAIAAIAILAYSFGSEAATPRSDADCAQLLERWATDPKAAPRSEVNACKDQLASIAPAAGPATGPSGERAAEPMAAVDPCSGPDAGASVLCWGPWSALAPAAAAPLASLSFADPAFDCSPGSALSEQCVPKLEPALPVAACQPGTPCGFATIVAGVTSTGDVEDTEFGRIDLNPDGTHFAIDPTTGEPIDSVGMMATVVTPAADGYGTLRSTGREGDVNSRLVARVLQDDDGKILMAADVWTHGTRENARSGYFAWGTATSQAGLDALKTGNVSLNFTGPMSVNNATTANLTVDFGGAPAWNGTWTNPAWSFGAGGPVSGVNLISTPDQFTDNVVGSGNFVQGAIVGEPSGPIGITHIIDVNLEGHGRIKDVGLLPGVVVNPVIVP